MNLALELFGAHFQNPVLLAAGTCGFGQELAEVIDLDRLGGFVTKSVTTEPRAGNPAPRVVEFATGMLNSVGLANPGLEATRREKLPWIAANVRRAQVFVSLAGHTVEDFYRLVEGLDASSGFLGFEINLSCPNDARRGGALFALDPEAVAVIVSGCRSRTDRPLLAKLAPHDPDLGRTVRIASEAGASALTLVNTVPGLLLDSDTGAPELGAGPGGVSGPALLPIGLRAVEEAGANTSLPLVAAGGVFRARDAVAYARAGASLVQVGTASFADPHVGERLARDLASWGGKSGIAEWGELLRARGGVPRWPR